MKNYLYAKDSGNLQLSYGEYTELMKKMEEAQNLKAVKAAVLADLQHFLKNGAVAPSPATPTAQPATKPKPTSAKKPAAEKVSVEFSAEKSVPPAQSVPAKTRAEVAKVPPIKKEITEHFNKLDESGRLFNVFKQYYTCLNDACGGTVRVTMKDGFCSLWNYDEWEEFAFIDIFENLLRITIDPRYTDALKALNLCDVPRLISSRRNAVSVQVDDLNNVVLDVLAQAFAEAGVQTK